MKETLFTLAMIGGIAVGAYYYFDEHGTLAPRIPIASSSSEKKAEEPFQWKNESLKHAQHAKGARAHEKTNQIHSQSIEGTDSNEGSSVGLTKTASLPTIYSSKSKRAGKRLKARIKAKTASKSKKKEKKIIHGISVEGWALSQQNALPSDNYEQGNEGMRVYLQCLELKGHSTKTLDKRDCNKLLVRRHEEVSRNYYKTF